jgi:thymidine kinase
VAIKETTNIMSKEEHVPSPVGKLTVYTGPMFSGKSTKLLELVQGWMKEGISYTLFKPVMDDRNGQREIVTHGGVNHPCVSVSSVAAIIKHMASMPHTNHVAIDEGQLFTESPSLREPITLKMAVLNFLNLDYTVGLAGLNLDFKGRMFPQMNQLSCIAEEHIRLQGSCKRCFEAPSTMSHRLIAIDNTFLIGGDGQYMPVCRSCFYSINPDYILA